MSVFKKASAFFSAVCLAAAFSGCSDTTYGLVVDDYTVPAGVYIYYANTAYNEAISELHEQNSELDVQDKKAVKAAAQTSQIDGVDTMTWIQDKATENCANFVAIEKKFDELELELDAATASYLDGMVQYYWSTYQDTMEDNGVSEESFRKVMTSGYKSQMLFDYYYGIDGDKGVQEDELREYYIDNTIRCQYIKFDLLDEEGNLLKSDGKADVMQDVKAYEKRVKDAWKDGGSEAVMAEMDAIQEEYTASQSEEETETEPVTEEPATESASDETAVEETMDATAAADETTDETESEAETGSEAEAETETEMETESETEAETEGETTAPYTNEKTISVINKDDYEDEADISYTPSEKVYNALLKAEDNAEPFIVEEDEAYYLVVRYDIEERMTEEDLWNENQIYSVEMAIYGEDFDALVKEWADALNVQKNEAAYKRYDPFKYTLDM